MGSPSGSVEVTVLVTMSVLVLGTVIFAMV